MGEPEDYFYPSIVPENNTYDENEYNLNSYNDESDEYQESKTNVTLHFKKDGTYDSEHTESEDIQHKNKKKKIYKIMKRGRPQVKNITAETEEERRKRNRVSAVMCRLRKKQHIQETYKYVEKLEASLNKMKEDNEKIQKENEILRKELIELRISLDTKNQIVETFLQKGFRC